MPNFRYGPYEIKKRANVLVSLIIAVLLFSLCAHTRNIRFDENHVRRESRIMDTANTPISSVPEDKKFSNVADFSISRSMRAEKKHNKTRQLSDSSGTSPDEFFLFTEVLWLKLQYVRDVMNDKQKDKFAAVLKQSFIKKSNNLSFEMRVKEVEVRAMMIKNKRQRELSPKAHKETSEIFSTMVISIHVYGDYKALNPTLIDFQSIFENIIESNKHMIVYDVIEIDDKYFNEIADMSLALPPVILTQLNSISEKAIPGTEESSSTNYRGTFFFAIFVGSVAFTVLLVATIFLVQYEQAEKAKYSSVNGSTDDITSKEGEQKASTSIYFSKIPSITKKAVNSTVTRFKLPKKRNNLSSWDTDLELELVAEDDFESSLDEPIEKVPGTYPEDGDDMDMGATNAGPEEILTCFAPPGKLRIAFDMKGGVPVIHKVKLGSPLEGILSRHDKVVGIDEVNTRNMTAADITKVMVGRMEKTRKISYIRVKPKETDEQRIECDKLETLDAISR